VANEIVASGGSAVAVYANVATVEGGSRIVATALENFGTVDILVNNAGYAYNDPIEEITEEQWDEIIGVNVKGLFTTTRAVVPVMKEKGWGRIVNIGSRVGVNGNVGYASYGAAKAGTVGFTFAMAHELAPAGITANCVMPTATTTKTEQARQRRAELTGVYNPPSQDTLPEHVAPIVLYLASDDGGGINGQLFHATGGDISLYAPPLMTRVLHKQGKWTQEELVRLVPGAFGADLGPPKRPVLQNPTAAGTQAKKKG
jgi:3-oxoacyl-[acyl-carrier protein] reductase